MKQITQDDLEVLSLGCAILGSGGGGDPTYATLMTKYLLEKKGPIKVLSINELKEEDLIVPLSIMGAPLINMERLLSGRELEILLRTVEEQVGRKPTVLMAAEIGGANGFTALMAAAQLGLPVLDADMIGRAFPELQMSSCYLNNLPCTPAVMVDCLGNRVVIETPDANTLEKIARSVTVSMGSSSVIAFYLMQGNVAAKSVVVGSLTRAFQLGRALKRQTLPATFLCHGTIVDIDQEVKEGFLQGSVTLQTDQGKIVLYYQNEYLLVKQGSAILACTPDILLLIDANSGTPLTSEMLRYGLQATLMVLEAPDIWKTPEGQKLVGYEVLCKNM